MYRSINRVFTETLSVQFAILRTFANFVKDESSRFLLVQFFNSSQFYRLLLSAYKSSVLEGLDPEYTHKTRLAAGTLIMELSRPETLSNVAENFIEGGILEIVDEINREADPRYT